MRRRLLAATIVVAVAGAVAAAILARGGGEPERTTEGAVRAPTQAFVPSVRAPRAVIWAVGDGADGGEYATLLAQRIAETPIDRLLYLGDVYETGSATDFAERYDPVYGRLAPITAPTPGNHDWPNHETGYDPYWKRVRGVSPPAYYSFRAAGWQLISLNSETDLSPSSPQVTWLRRQLSGSGTCRIAFWHRARFSAGTHGDYEPVDTLWRALSGKAAVVVAAHDHDMQRHEPRDGIVQFVSGAGGKSLYEIDESDPRLAFWNDTDFGALRLELTTGMLRFAFVTLDGETVDSGTVRCRR